MKTFCHFLDHILTPSLFFVSTALLISFGSHLAGGIIDDGIKSTSRVPVIFEQFPAKPFPLAQNLTVTKR